MPRMRTSSELLRGSQGKLLISKTPVYFVFPLAVSRIFIWDTLFFSFSIAKPRALLYNKYKVQNEVTVWNTKPQNLRAP